MIVSLALVVRLNITTIWALHHCFLSLETSVVALPVVVLPVCLLIVPAPSCLSEHCLRMPMMLPNVTLRVLRSEAGLIITFSQLVANTLLWGYH